MNPFNESDVKDAAEEFNLIDSNNKKYEFIGVEKKLCITEY